MATVAEEQVASWLGGRSLASWRDEFDRRGYLICERVLPQDRVAEIRAALAPHLARDLKGRNDFEGVKTTASTRCWQNRRCLRGSWCIRLRWHSSRRSWARAAYCRRFSRSTCNLARPCNRGISTTAARRSRDHGRRSASALSGRSITPLS